MVFLGETKKSRFSHPHTNALPAFGWDESDAARAATIPFDGYARPILFNDGAFCTSSIQSNHLMKPPACVDARIDGKP